MNSRNLRISIIIPVYNEAAYIERCLRAIAEQIEPPHEVIVVDNNSSDATVQLARQFTFVKVLHERRQGRSYAMYTGFQAATGDILARIDADTVVPEDWTAVLRESFMDQRMAAVSGRGVFTDNFAGRLSGWLQVMVYQYFQRLISGTYHLWGANMALRRQAWQSVQGSLSYRNDIDEDIDLSLCLQTHGWRVQYNPALKIQASLRRGELDFASNARYLATWPRDYRLHHRRVAAVLVLCMNVVILLATLPVSFYSSVQLSWRRWRHSRRRR